MMNKQHAALALALLTAAGPALAAEPPQPSRVSIRYHEYRQAKTIPPYSLAKVRALVRGIKTDQQENKRLNARAFSALTSNEKFTYTMIHAEDFDQNCDASPGILHEEGKIFAYVPSAFEDVGAWSDRQVKFLTGNRSRVIALLRETIRKQHRVGANFKHAILELHASELISDLADVYKATRKDHDILTVMMILMRDAKYRPFTSTRFYVKLFGEHADFGASLPATPANQKLVLDHAAAFYRSRKA